MSKLKDSNNNNKRRSRAIYRRSRKINE